METLAEGGEKSMTRLWSFAYLIAATVLAAILIRDIHLGGVYTRTDPLGHPRWSGPLVARVSIDAAFYATLIGLIVFLMLAAVYRWPIRTRWLKIAIRLTGILTIVGALVYLLLAFALHPEPSKLTVIVSSFRMAIQPIIFLSTWRFHV